MWTDLDRIPTNKQFTFVSISDEIFTGSRWASDRDDGWGGGDGCNCGTGSVTAAFPVTIYFLNAPHRADSGSINSAVNLRRALLNHNPRKSVRLARCDIDDVPCERLHREKA